MAAAARPRFRRGRRENIAMLDYALGFLARSAVMIPSVLLAYAALWEAGKKLGCLRLDPAV